MLLKLIQLIDLKHGQNCVNLFVVDDIFISIYRTSQDKQAIAKIPQGNKCFLWADEYWMDHDYKICSKIQIMYQISTKPKKGWLEKVQNAKSYSFWEYSKEYPKQKSLFWHLLFLRHAAACRCSVILKKHNLFVFFFFLETKKQK